MHTIAILRNALFSYIKCDEYFMKYLYLYHHIHSDFEWNILLVCEKLSYEERMLYNAHITIYYNTGHIYMNSIWKALHKVLGLWVNKFYLYVQQ